jgi:hypothetical protein
MSRRIFGAVCAGTLLAGCASDRVDHGGVMSAAPHPADAVSCRGSGTSRVHGEPPSYPPAAAAFMYAAQSGEPRRIEYAFDVDSEGRTVNIRFTGPGSYTRHAAMRSLILAGAEAISGWEYEWQEEPGFALGCMTSFDYMGRFGTPYDMLGR